MPDFHVNSDRTKETSSQLQADFHQATEMLAAIKARVDGLLADGYRTPAAEQQFSPFFEKFHQGYTQTTQGLDGISKYVGGVGDAFDQTDSQLGQSLAQ
jgi:uncharacterized protein YukE